MTPVFEEYIKFLKDNNVDINIESGYYWIDRQIIRGFDKNGESHKVVRILIDDNLNVSCKKYDTNNVEFISWKELVELKKDEILMKENESINLIKKSISKYNEYEPICLTSGGKDSSVTMYLLRQVVPNSKGIFNNTSLDCADTYLYIKDLKNIETISPEEGFYQWRERNNFIPTRFARACCSIFKENALLEKYDNSKKSLFFMGMRNSESANRSEYGDEWSNDIWGDNWKGILPIRKWTDLDVWLYILMKDIPINKKYKKGYARVGCAVACPFYSKSTWTLDKYWYEYLYERWQEILQDDFIENNKWIVMNCTLKEYKTCWNGGVFREEPTEDVINEFAEYNKLNYDVAKNYFNHTCTKCKKAKKIKDKEVLAMNMKLLGRTSKKMCKKHLKEFLSMSEDEWKEQVESFKASGCSLF